MDLQLPAGKGDALRVVSRGRAHHAGLALLGGEGGNEVVGAAHLVGTAHLVVFALEEDRLAPDSREAQRQVQRGAANGGSEGLCGDDDVRPAGQCAFHPPSVPRGAVRFQPFHRDIP